MLAHVEEPAERHLECVTPAPAEFSTTSSTDPLVFIVFTTTAFYAPGNRFYILTTMRGRHILSVVVRCPTTYPSLFIVGPLGAIVYAAGILLPIF